MPWNSLTSLNILELITFLFFSLLHVLKGKDSIVHTGSKCRYREGRKQVVKHLFLSK